MSLLNFTALKYVINHSVPTLLKDIKKTRLKLTINTVRTEMLAKVWTKFAQILRDKLRSLKSWWQVNYRSHLSLKLHIENKRVKFLANLTGRQRPFEANP